MCTSRRKRGERIHIRSLNVGKHCPLDLDPRILFDGLLSHFIAYMLPFTIAIGPYIESFAVLGLLLDVCGYGYFVLDKALGGGPQVVMSARDDEESRVGKEKGDRRKRKGTNFCNTVINLSIKQSLWRRMLPILVIGSEITFCEVAKDRGHNDFTPSPLATEVEVEFIVLVVLRARDVVLGRG